jgi:hypothetical protein
MKKLLLVGCLLLVASCSAQALQPEIIGGIRDGMAIGVMADTPLGRNIGARFGAEVNSGAQPVILFGGVKMFMTYFGSSPMYLGLGGVFYSGGNSGNSSSGLALSLVFNRAFNVSPMFVECGIDFLQGTNRLQAQLGYKIY